MGNCGYTCKADKPQAYKCEPRSQTYTCKADKPQAYTCNLKPTLYESINGDGVNFLESSSLVAISCNDWCLADCAFRRLVIVPSVFALVFWDYDTNYLTHLNDDMQVKIASYLRNHGFLMLRLTCKHYYAFGLKRGDIIVGDNYIPYNQLDVSSNDSITDISAYTSLSYDHTTKRIDNTQRPLPLGALRSLARFPHANGKCRKWKILLEKGIKLSTFTAVTEKDVSNQNYIIGDLIIVEETPINQFIEVNRSVCMITLIKPFQVMRKVNLLLDGLNMRSCASWTSLNMIHYWNADNVIIYWTNTNNIKIVTSYMFSTLCSVSHCGRRIDMTYFHDEEYSPTFKRALTKNALFPMRYHVSHPHLRMSENALKSYDERDVFGINSVWNQ